MMEWELDRLCRSLSYDLYTGAEEGSTLVVVREAGVRTGGKASVGSKAGGRVVLVRV